MNLPSDHFTKRTLPNFFTPQDFDSIPQLSKGAGPSSNTYRPDLIHQDSRDDCLDKDRIRDELEEDGGMDSKIAQQIQIQTQDGTSEIVAQQNQTTLERSSDSNNRSGNNEPEKPNPSFGDKVKQTLKNHLSFIGPGIIASVAYADPGNWATDLQAGSEFGYKLLFIVLLSGLFAILLQVLCCRLGIITGLDLARATRQLILGQSVDHKRHCPDGYPLAKPKDKEIDRKSWNWKARLVTLYVLYVIAEGAIIATELAELIGSALALNMLFPSLPLWGGVLVTSFDVFLILFVYRPGSGIRAFELLIGFLVLIVLSCFIALLVKVDPNWADVFDGYVPSSTIVGSKALYVSIGILGATVMPHGLFLGSHCALLTRIETDDGTTKERASSTSSSPRQSVEISGQSSAQERVASSASKRSNLHETVDDNSIPSTPFEGRETSSQRDQDQERSTRPARWISSLQNLISRTFPSIDMSAVTPIGSNRRLRAAKDFVSSLGLSGGAIIPELDYKPGSTFKRPQASLKHVKLHVPHACWDVALSLVFFAITINSAILIVAGAAFYFNSENPGQEVVADLHDAFVLLSDSLGKAFGILFAIALLAAGQSASITVTLAGQIISEGYINWKTSPFARRVVTRVIALLPSLLVATIVGKDGLDTMLVASQVALSMALPFVTFPLLVITGSKLWMRVWEGKERIEEGGRVGNSDIALAQTNSNQENALEQIPTEEQQQHQPTTDLERGQAGTLHFFHNRIPVAILAWIVFGVIVVADGYVLITLFLGED